MVILGSTGSIGVNSLLIANKFNIEVEALSCNKNVDLLNLQIAKFKPKFVCVGDESLVKSVNHKTVFVGENGLLKMLENCKSKKVINALVGFAGLKPSIKTQNLNKTLCLANKESLVVAGKFLDTKKIVPIDSEHFGLKFLLKEMKIYKMIITASGGAFRDANLNMLKNATPKDALKHPNWSMGAKITIDSATMMNKLFEIMEAFHLYKVSNLDAFIERTSTIHALIEFIDGSTTAHISKTDMKLAIANAVLDEIGEPILEHFDLLSLEKGLKFEKIDLEKYPVFSLKDEVIKNPDLGVIINAANEIYVNKFLNNECKFLDIKKIIFESLDKFASFKPLNLEEIFEMDKKVREFAKKLV